MKIKWGHRIRFQGQQDVFCKINLAGSMQGPVYLSGFLQQFVDSLYKADLIPYNYSA